MGTGDVSVIAFLDGNVFSINSFRLQKGDKKATTLCTKSNKMNTKQHVFFFMTFFL